MRGGLPVHQAVDADLAGAGDVGDVQFPFVVGELFGPFQRTFRLLLHEFGRDVFEDAFTEPTEVVRPERLRLGHEVLLGLGARLARHVGDHLGDDGGLVGVEGAGRKPGGDHRGAIPGGTGQASQALEIGRAHV